MNWFLGIITPLVVYAFITLLHIAIPVKKIKGYVKDDATGELLNYRINGKFVLWISILIWFLLGYFEIVPYTWFYDNRWQGLIGAVAMGYTPFTWFASTRQQTNLSLPICGWAE